MNYDARKLPCCGAKIRGKAKTTCQRAAMPNGRCYLHGGKSTGPRTAKGLERMKLSKIKSGYYCKKRIAERREFHKYMIEAKTMIDNLED